MDDSDKEIIVEEEGVGAGECVIHMVFMGVGGSWSGLGRRHFLLIVVEEIKKKKK